ncbi:MAG TPA: hypothetical protein VFS60_05670, partial [Thermoanaerobaculia bacterium]|nr:hypothetical protein [Thermoanaerobaculia bacterium]
MVTGNDQFAGGSYPADLTAFGAKVAFTAEEDSIGREVWVTDSETGRTRPLGDLCKDCGGNGPKIVGAVGPTLLFVEPRGKRLLWASDGTARGTHAVLDANVEAEALLPGRLVFIVDGESGLVLWRTDGTPGGTTELATFAGAYDVIALLVSGNRAFLLLRSLTAVEVWSTDGTTGGTRKLAEAASAFPSARLSAATTTHLFFVTTTGAAGQELWASDGTVAGTRVVSSFAAPDPFHITAWLKPIGKHVYFFADDITHGVELWRSDGTPQGTVRTTDFGFSEAFEDLDNADQVEELNGKIVFFATDGFGPLRLWTSTGSPASTKVLSGVCSDPCSLDADSWLRRLGNRLFFPAVSSPPTYAEELWFTDGTAAGSGLLVDSCPSFCARSISRPRLLGDRLYFLASSPSGRELWSSDGTPAGTREVSGFKDPDPFQEFIPLLTPEVVAVGGRIWFAAEQYPYGQELWSTAGTPETTALAANVNRSGASSDPTSFAAFGDRVLFAAARCDGGGHDLWVSDGASTQRLSPFFSECFGHDIEQPVVVSGPYAYYWRDDFAPTLWRTDGTPAGTIALTTLPDLHYPSSPLPIDGGVAFTVHDGYTGELWRSDGTAAGTVKRFDLVGRPEALFADGQNVYFVATPTAAPDRQVWRADLGSGALLPLTAFGPGEPLDGSTPPRFTKLGSLVYFWLETAGHRIALWRTDGTPAGT